MGNYVDLYFLTSSCPTFALKNCHVQQTNRILRQQKNVESAPWGGSRTSVNKKGGG
jgi:hypothetical protein